MRQSSDAVRVFPHVLIRISGAPFGPFEALQFSEAAEHAARLCAYDAQTAEQRHHLSDALYPVIPAVDDAAVRALKRRDLKTELSLTKYLSRLHAKTSPFSTFTNLMMARIAERDGAQAGMLETAGGTSEAGGLGVTSYIRLNNFLYQYLKALLTRYPDVYRRLSLRPNPTIVQEEAHYLYLTNSNNIESFQRLPAHPVVALFRLTCSVIIMSC